ncbi:hypothetical protein AYO44_01760 [Planctomycetaceae bacterium SCGC AG-212-F19]|nr:hypothetical protein AYO44_01760 [Planctomycetaceae bacterium SCGC AG-212-F19]
MSLRRECVVVLLGALASLGAAYRTTNFQVEAPTPQIAQQVGQAAEYYRREKALQWLGQEMPTWPEPCPLHVKVTMSGAGGATSFAFDQGRVLGQHMNIEGSLERLLNSVLPHEVTHTVFAQYYRRPVPRWADEGGAVLSEDDIERNRHDMLCRQILNTPGRMIPLRRLFALKEYPGDVMVLYAEGFSVANFLVTSSSRQAFLAFVAHGMQQGWDSAAQVHYRYRSVEELEQAWLNHLRSTRRPPDQLVKNTVGPGNDPGQHVVVRQTIPPAQPLDFAPVPTYRGANPAGDMENDRQPIPATGTVGRPTYLPDYPRPAPPTPAVGLAPPSGWSPVPPGNAGRPPTVQLGPPQFGQ